MIVMKKRWAFTFIELIVALVVFSIGVLAVLRLITQNLVTLDITQSRTMATFLAKEWMELVYNMRDSNIDKWLPWDCLLQEWLIQDADTACIWNFSLWGNKILQISFDSGVYTYAQTVNLGTNFKEIWSWNRLYYTTWGIWWHQIFWYSSLPAQGSTLTPFSRYILFTGVREWTNLLPRDSILKIESHVLYNKWGKTWEVVLESFIWNYK